MMLSYGQPLGAICQMAFIVPDVREAVSAYTKALKTGPWLLIEHFVPAWQCYRGAPTDADLSVATAYSGSMMIELIQQHDDGPSVYREVLETRGYGFHHYAVTARAFDEECSRYAQLGYETAFEAQFDAAMNNARVAYFDARADLPGMIELLEMNYKLEAFFSAIKRMSIDWNGKDPIRSLDQLPFADNTP